MENQNKNQNLIDKNQDLNIENQNLNIENKKSVKKIYRLHINFFETISKFLNICYNKTIIYHTIIKNTTINIFLLIYLNSLLPSIHFITHRLFNYIIWFLLGILSSIGFGTGMQTGVLFVFPEIISEYQRNIEYYGNNTSNIYYSYLRCLPMVLIWGIGTAFGELPPYFIAKKINYKDNKSLDKMYNLLGDNSESVKNSVKNNVEKFRKNKKYSFYTILLLSSWPNAMFDICGISAGLVKLRIEEFLIPTIIGKAFIKTPLQLGFILYSYANYGESLNNNDEIGYLYYLWNTFVISFTLYVFKEYIESVVN